MKIKTAIRAILGIVLILIIATAITLWLTANIPLLIYCWLAAFDWCMVVILYQSKSVSWNKIINFNREPLYDVEHFFDYTYVMQNATRNEVRSLVLPHSYPSRSKRSVASDFTIYKAGTDIIVKDEEIYDLDHDFKTTKEYQVA